MVLGHETSGTISAVGEGVTHLEVGKCWFLSNINENATKIQIALQRLRTSKQLAYQRCRSWWLIAKSQTIEEVDTIRYFNIS